MGAELQRHRLQLFLKLRWQQRQMVEHLFDLPELLLLVALSAPHPFQQPQRYRLIGDRNHSQQAAGVRTGIADELIERCGERVVQVIEFLRIAGRGGEQRRELREVFGLFQRIQHL